MDSAELTEWLALMVVEAEEEEERQKARENAR